MFDLMLNGGMNMLSSVNRNQLIEELDLVLRIRRNNIISDTLGILQLQEPQDLRKKLRIIFDQEQGTLTLSALSSKQFFYCASCRLCTKVSIKAV